MDVLLARGQYHPYTYTCCGSCSLPFMHWRLTMLVTAFGFACAAAYATVTLRHRRGLISAMLSNVHDCQI